MRLAALRKNFLALSCLFLYKDGERKGQSPILAYPMQICPNTAKFSLCQKNIFLLTFQEDRKNFCEKSRFGKVFA